MLFVWAFDVIIWLSKLPLYLLPGADFLAIPDQITTAVGSLGGYTHWFFYLLGPTAGDALTLTFQWMIPVLIAVFLWERFKGLALAAVGILRPGSQME